MIDLIVFGVGSNRYAMNIENIQRIIQANHLTSIPNAHPYIDGMMSHEDSVIKVMSFRKLINYASYEDELKALFKELKNTHKDWLDALKVSVDTGSTFEKTTDPHICELGKWIDGFTSYDDRVSEVLSQLVGYHKELHLKGAEVCEIKKNDIEQARQIFDIDINNIYNHTMDALDTFVQELGGVADSLQKLLICETNEKKFAIKVDTIEDIAHVEESDIMVSDSDQKSSEFLELEGILDLNGVLINIIKTIKLPN